MSQGSYLLVVNLLQDNLKLFLSELRKTTTCEGSQICRPHCPAVWPATPSQLRLHLSFSCLPWLVKWQTLSAAPPTTQLAKQGFPEVSWKSMASCRCSLKPLGALQVAVPTVTCWQLATARRRTLPPVVVKTKSFARPSPASGQDAARQKLLRWS